MPFFTRARRASIQKRPLITLPPVDTGVNLIASPTVLGSLSNGTVLTVGAAIWTGGPTITRQFYRDGVAISGATSTYTYNAVTDDGCAITVVETANGSITSTSPARIGKLNSIVYHDDFNYPDGTGLSTVPGWHLSGLGSAAYQVLGAQDSEGGMEELKIINGDIQGVANGTSVYGTGTRYVYDAGSTDFIMRYTYSQYYAPGTISYQNSGMTLTGRWNGTNNYVQANFVYNKVSLGCFYPYTAENGNYRDFGYSDLPDYVKDGDILELRLQGDYAQLWYNGLRVGDTTVNGGLGYNVGLTTKTNLIMYTAQVGPGSSTKPSYPIPFIKAVELASVPTNSIELASASISNPGQARGQNKVRLVGNIKGAVTQLQYLIMDQNGKVVTDWTNVGTVSGNAFDFNTGNIDAVVEGTTAKFYIRDYLNKNTVVSTSVVVPEYQTVSPFVKGMNEGYMDAYVPSVTHRNLAQRLDWRHPSYTIISSPGVPDQGSNYTSASDVGMGYDGIIHKYKAGADPTIVGALPNSISPGTYTITYPVGMTLQMVNGGSGFSIVQAPSNGTCQFSISSYTTSGGALAFSGPIPTSGLVVDIKKNGDSTPNLLVADEVLGWYSRAGTKVVRHMTQSGVNFDQNFRTNPSQIWTGSVSGNPVTVDFQIECANRSNQDLWFNVSHCWDDSVTAWMFNRIQANLKPGLRCWIEISNETWNQAFTQGGWFRREGIRGGLHTTNGTGGVRTGVLRDLSNDFSSWDVVTGYSKIAINQGDWVYAGRYGLGNFMWEAKTNIPANDPTYGVDAAGGDNAYWKVISNEGQSVIAGKRKYSEVCKRVWALADTIFTTPRTRTVRVLGGWHNGGLEYSKESFRWANLWQGVDKLATAPYWDSGSGTLNYEDTSIPGWTQTDKDLCVTNPTLFLTKYFAATEYAIESTVAFAQETKHAMARWLKSEFGLPIDTVELCSYECNWGVGVTGNWPNKQAIANLWPGIIRDIRNGQNMTTYMNKLASRVGGTHVFFDRISPAIGTGYDPNYFQLLTWAITWAETDIDAANYRFTAFADWPTALIPPTPPAPTVITADSTTLKADRSTSTVDSGNGISGGGGGDVTTPSPGGGAKG